ncbi:MAG TPA: MBL fold metallo-hydrolase [Gemmatimonadales bacterium]|nr:MBL fold metallo-hydrolase [Gemmatimonadales bacterium]
MTMLTMLGSGSSGNACLLSSGAAVILLDAGFSAREIARRAELAGVSLDGLCGIALTHEHGDHAQGAVRLARRHRVPVLASVGTWTALGAPADVEFRPLRTASRAECGPFTLTACSLLHDAAEPLALTVTTIDGLSLGVAYDFGRATQALRYHFREVNAIVLEANYDEVMLRTSHYPASVQHRIAGSGGHLSNRATAQLLTELHHAGLSTVVLAHLSRQCNSPDAARAAIEPVLRRSGFRGELHVAVQQGPLQPIALSRGQLSLSLG